MITANVKSRFFDRKAVIDAVGRVKAQRMAKAGAFVRTAARTSMRRRKASAAPGSPPSAHSQDPVASLKNILFAWDPRTKSVVVGSVGLNMLSVRSGTYVRGTVPGVQEFGGTVGIPESQYRNGTWHRADLRSRRRLAQRPFRIRNATYPARPYMTPAMNRELPKFPELWKNAVVRSTA